MEPDFFASELESFNLRALAGYIKERSDTPLGGVPADIAGGFATPEFTTNITANYAIGPLAFQLQMRHIDSSLVNTTWVEGRDVDDNTVASSTWFNGQIGYTGETADGSSWNVALNVQNLFDRNPPIIASYGSRGGSQTVSDNYDTLGRRYQLSLNYNF
jgi:outer membrane receptor protein involved in Fe transport